MLCWAKGNPSSAVDVNSKRKLSGNIISVLGKLIRNPIDISTIGCR